MSEENKIQYNYSVDQATSANAYFDVEIEGETVRLQLTARHNARVDDIVADTEKLIEAYSRLRKAHPRQLKPASNTTFTPDGELKYLPVDDFGNEMQPVKSIVAERLSVSMKDGKYYYKVIGKPFSEYGITVWPEVFENAGLKVAPDNLPNIAGWHVDYVEKPANDKGKIWPDKVTRLLPPK